MNEMVERVAKALNKEMLGSVPPEMWDSPPFETTVNRLRRMARAATEAMRHPSMEMLNRGYESCDEAATTWDAMIDAALAGDKP